jgi:hypothetical protein
MTPKNEACSGIREHIGQGATVAFALVWVACGMKTEMLASAPDSSATSTTAFDYCFLGLTVQ